MDDIKLVPFSELDEDELTIFFDIRYSDYVHEKFGGNKPTLESHLTWTETAINSDYYKGFAITSGGEVIGGCSLKNISLLNSNAEFDIFLSKKFSGKGYGKTALKKLLKFGFKEMGLHRIYAYLLESNKNALKMYTQVGFQEEGILRENVKKNNRYLNSIIIGFLREEYEDHH